ncbi:MAG: ferredoxin [Verrucomicrobia bacterium]|nr:ferredoxin [Verrucomicrobiota bacterium]
MKTSAELEKQAALQVAALMAAAARTSPKTRGIDNVRVLAIDDDASKQRLIAKMREIAAAENRPGLARDAGNIENSPAIVVIGVESNPAGLNCGFCGKPTCDELSAAGGVCAFNSMDLGIATCSAAAVASLHHVDNRMMYSIGRAALDLRLFGENVKQALGLPLSITGKSPFFDRKP